MHKAAPWRFVHSIGVMEWKLRASLPESANQLLFKGKLGLLLDLA